MGLSVHGLVPEVGGQGCSILALVEVGRGLGAGVGRVN